MSASLGGVWQQATTIWSKGGWAMIAIAVIAFVMFAMGTHIHLCLKRKSRLTVGEETWRRWIDHPNERAGELGDMLDFVTGGRSLSEMSYFFGQLRGTETAPFERDLKVMKVCVSAAPLVGLLGTVTGMLSTFGALASGAGGDQTMGMVASGISEALITTETGLVIALPGLFFQYQLARRFAHFKAFLAHLETVCTQTFYRHLSDERAQAARRVAAEQVATTLRARLQARAGSMPEAPVPQGAELDTVSST
ncbi:MAG: MotA/TolQ/ExbB proton channel family protein [Planctomycetota bacterium]